MRTRYNEILRTLLERVFRDIKRIMVHQQFTTSPKDFLILCDVEWRQGVGDPEEALSRIVDDLDWFDEAIVISTDGKRTLCFVKGVYSDLYTELFTHTTREFLCFIEFPMTLCKDHATFDMIGPPREVGRLIGFMREWGSDLEILAGREYHTRDKGLLSVLTERQRLVMKQAYDAGFFDHPRRSDARTISERIGIRHTTFLAHIRKGQRRLMGELFGD